MGNEVRIRVTANDDTGRTLKAVEQKFRNFGRMRAAEIKITARDDTDRTFKNVERKFRALARKKAAVLDVTVKEDVDRGLRAAESKVRTAFKGGGIKLPVDVDDHLKITAADIARWEKEIRTSVGSTKVRIPVRADLDRGFGTRLRAFRARIESDLGHSGLRAGAAFMAGFVKVVTFGQVGSGFSAAAARMAPKMARIGAALGGALAAGIILQVTNLLTAGLPLALGSAMLALPIVGLIKPMIDAQKEIEKVNLKIATKRNLMIEAEERVREASNKKQRAAAKERVRDIQEEISQLEKSRKEWEKKAEPLVKLTDRFKHFVAEIAKPVKVPLLATMELLGDRLKGWEKPVREAFAKLAPALKPFTEGVLGGIEEFFKAIGREMPGIKAGMEAWGAVMPKIGKTFGEFIAKILRDPEKTRRALENFAGALDDVAEAAGNIINWLQDAADAYGNFAKEIDDAENAGAKGLGEGVVRALDDLNVKIDDKIKEIRDTFGKWLLHGGPAKELKRAFSRENMTDAYNAINDWSKDFSDAIVAAFSRENMVDAYNAITGIGKSLGKDSSKAFEEGVKDEKPKPDLLWDAYKNFFVKTYDKFIAWFKNLGKDSNKAYQEGVKDEEPDEDLLWGAIKKAVHKAIEWLKRLPGRAANAVGGIGDKIAGKIKDGQDKITQKAKDLVNKVVDWFKKLPGKAKNALSSLASKAGSEVEQAKDRVVQKAKDMVNKATDWIAKLPGKAKNALNSLAPKVASEVEQTKDRVLQKAKDMVNRFIDRMQEMVRKARDQAGKVKGAITAKFNGAKNWLYDEGKAVINGLLDGLKSPWKKVQNWVSGIAKWIKAHKGPVSLDRQLLVPAGKALMGGLLEGLKFGFGGVGDFVYKAGSKVSDIIGKIKSSFLGDWSGKIGKITGGRNRLLSAIANTFHIRGGTYPGHGERGASKAWDFMIHSKAMGNAIASFAKTFARQLGVLYVIWNKRIWNIQRASEGWRPYTRYGSSGSPSQMHTNHVHVSLRDKGGILRSGEIAANLSGQAERVLSPAQTRSFENLVRVMERGGSSGGNTTIIINAPHYVGSQDDLRRTLVDMNRRGQLEVIKGR